MIRKGLPEVWKWSNPTGPVKWGDSPCKGVGLFLGGDKEISAGREVCFLPASKTITSEDVMGLTKNERMRFIDNIQEKCSVLFPRHTPNFGIMSRLIITASQMYMAEIKPEVVQAPFSKYALGTSLKDLPMFYDQKTMPYLMKSSILPKLLGYKTILNKLNEEVLNKSFPGLNPTAFLHLFGFIRSRALNLTPLDSSKAFDPLVISPVFDLLNHEFKPSCIIDSIFDRITDESAFVLRSIRNIKPGEELTVSYGKWGRVRIKQDRQPRTLLAIRVCD